MPDLPRHLIGLLLVAAGSTLACNRNDAPAPPPATTQSPADAPATERVVGPLSEADAAALATMNERVSRYIELHTTIESRLPKLPQDATPLQIDTNQRAFEQRIREARKNAKPGDLFTPESQVVIKRLLATVFGGPDGQQLKASIMDEYSGSVKLAVNTRYPDSVPISTMPPQVLQTLPKLSEDLEYRFIGDNLIIFDVHAHVVADFIENAMPK